MTASFIKLVVYNFFGPEGYQKNKFPDHQTIVSTLFPALFLLAKKKNLITKSTYFLTSECNICFLSVYTHPERPIYNFAIKISKHNIFYNREIRYQKSRLTERHVCTDTKTQVTERTWNTPSGQAVI